MEQLNSVVRRTVESGVPPIKTTYTAVWNTYGDKIIAFRGQTTVRSVLYGALGEEELDGELSDSVAMDLFLRNVGNAFALAKLSPKTRDWYSVKCNVPLGSIDFDALLALTQGSRLASRVCVEFPQSVLSNADLCARTFAEFRKAGFVTAICGYGSARFPVIALLTATPNVLFLEPTISVQAATPSRSGAVRSLVDFAVNLGVNVVALGVENDEQIRSLRAANCFGVCPSANYNGVYDCRLLTLADEQAPCFDEVADA